MLLNRATMAAGLTLTLMMTGSAAFAQSTVVERGQTQCRQVALTFDAGSTAVSAQGIMDALAAHDDRSTFFLTGAWTDDYPSLAAERTPIRT